MPPGGFKVQVHREGPYAVVAPCGELDLETVDELREALRGHEDVRTLRLDLRELSFMDSSGVSLILEELRRAQADGFAFELIPGPDRVQRLFEVTGLTGRLVWAEPPDAAGPDRGKAAGA